jgi:hypothetical protein
LDILARWALTQPWRPCPMDFSETMDDEGKVSF